MSLWPYFDAAIADHLQFQIRMINRRDFLQKSIQG
jgi:hypothetical protein